LEGAQLGDSEASVQERLNDGRVTDGAEIVTCSGHCAQLFHGCAQGDDGIACHEFVRRYEPGTLYASRMLHAKITLESALPEVTNRTKASI
jgi:hypothetical protein